jgi:hypothetical protein
VRLGNELSTHVHSEARRLVSSLKEVDNSINRPLSITLTHAFSALSADAFAKNGISVAFKNTSTLTITNLYFLPAKEAHWGEDQLGDGESDTIKPDEEFTL